MDYERTDGAYSNSNSKSFNQIGVKLMILRPFARDLYENGWTRNS